MPEIDGISLPFIPAGGVEELRKNHFQNDFNNKVSSFDSVLQDEINKVKFSSHAQTRLIGRDINLTDNDVSRLEQAVHKAGEKGSNVSLILLNNNAYIVSVPNRTVITVVNNNDMNEGIITNIDSAVFA